MSKGRISNAERTSCGSSVKEMHRFLGLSLAGGKSDKACLAVIEYFPKYKKIFLTKIFERIKTEDEISADLKIFEYIEQVRENAESLSMDTPWQVPLCLRCEMKCPGYENCKEPHIEWMWKHSKEKNKKKKPKKIFTPYTQRSVEMIFATEFEEPFILPHALGANQAPLLARAAFLKKRIDLPTLEIYPKASLWRLGRSLNVMKSHLRYHRHSVGGAESRRVILQALGASNTAFVYEQDIRLMTENNHAFEAFLCAFTGFLQFKGLTEERPKGFPKNEDWIQLPLGEINWKALA